MKAPIRMIVEAAADVFDTTGKDILSKTRLRPIVRARHAVCHVAREEGWSTTIIGKHLGHYDHTTVSYACEQVPIHLERDMVFAARVEELRARAIASRGAPMTRTPSTRYHETRAA